MKPRNMVIYGSDERLRELEAEYKMLGFFVKRTNESLTVYTRPRKRKTVKKRRSNRAGSSRNTQKPKRD